MADRLNQLPFRDQINISYFGINKIKQAVTYSGVNASAFNQDFSYYGNANEDRIIADLLIPARNQLARAFMGLTAFWKESNPLIWGDFTFLDTVRARTNERVSKDFAIRSLTFGNLGPIYCDQYFMGGLTAWNTMHAQYSNVLTSTVVDPIDLAFADLNTAYEAAKQHCQQIIAS